MKRILLVLALPMLFLLVPAASQAQSYDLALGGRLSQYLGLSAKYNFDERSAVEAVLETRWRGFIATAVYEFHFELNRSGDLRLYVGGGPYFGVWSNPWANHPVFNGPDGGTLGGLNFVVGLEYAFPSIPLQVSIDAMPGYYMHGFRGWKTDDFGLGARFTF